MCFGERKQICFEDTLNDDDNWLRADVAMDERHVIVDRGGLCRLDAADCQALAQWLMARAAEFPPAPAKATNRRGRYAAHHKGGRRRMAETAA